MDKGLQNEDFEDSDVRRKNTLHPLELQFMEPTHRSKTVEDKVPRQTQSPSFLQLFRYATFSERCLSMAGFTLAVVAGMCAPFFVLMFGEFATLLAERNLDNITSSRSPILSWYGGGQILVNADHSSRMSALKDDSVAYVTGVAIYSLCQFVIGIIAITCMNHSAINQICRVRLMFLRALLRQEQAWHDTHGAANFATSLTDDIEKMQDAVGEKVVVFVIVVVSFLSTVIGVFLKGWELTLVALSCVPIIVIAQTIVSKMQRSLAVQEQKSYSAAGAVVEEVLGAIRTVVAFGGEKKEVEGYRENLVASKKMGVKRGLYTGLGDGGMSFTFFCSYALAFWHGTTLLLEDRYVSYSERDYTPGVIIIVFAGIFYGAQHLSFILYPQLEAFNNARGAASVVFEILERQPLIDCLGEEGVRPTHILGDLEFIGVHFRYPARPTVPVLKGLSLKVSRGQTVAIVGHSGCGKSTAVQLIQRLYDPEHGTVLIDGMDARKLNVAWLRAQIGVVGQEPVLFDMTIEENIRYGTPHASVKEICRAAREANAHDFISKLPLGYQTWVGERGAQLSGGQKQRIAIARALVRRPAILLLDEATSALDRANEAQVQAALDAASRGRTTVVVAHRLSTVRAADRIIVLSEGKLVEQGTHDELMERKGHYHALVAVDAANADNTLSFDDVHEMSTAFRRASATELTEISTGARFAEVKSKEEDETSPAASLGRIMAFNAPEWPYVAVGCASALVVGFCPPAFAALFGGMYKILSLPDADDVRADSNLFCGLFLVLGVCQGLGTFLQTIALAVAGVRLTDRLRTSVFGAILRQEVGWFDEDRNSVGALCARLAGDTAAVKGATGYIGIVLQLASSLLVGFCISLYLSWKMALVSSIAVPIVLFSATLELVIGKRHAQNEKHALENASRVAVEAVSQVRTIAGLGAELATLQRFERELDKALVAGRRRSRFRGLFYALGQSVPYLCGALSIWYGSSILVAEEGLSYEGVIIITRALVIASFKLGVCLAYAPNFGAAKLAAGRLFTLLDRQPRITGPSSAVNRQSLVGDVAFSRVRFSYPTRPGIKVLRGLDLLIKPGQTVALVGASGCGKSTCIQLLQRFYDPDRGEVSMGEKNVHEVPLTQLRRELGIVSQEPVLFNRTIAENIAYGDNQRVPDMAEIVAVAQQANIHAFITSLPLGYDTRLGQKGTQLSGGQKQRIAIARALLRNPRVLLLDEATSALDSQSEQVVQAALDQAREGRTCITIAHRLATVQNADLICVLDRGTLAEAGTHAELMRLGGLYSRMRQQAAAVP